MKRITLTFGRIVIDLKHQFFGKSDPTAFCLVDCWSKEGEDQDVRVDHFRGEVDIKYEDLRNPEKFFITRDFIDCEKPIQEQLDKSLNNYLKAKRRGLD